MSWFWGAERGWGQAGRLERGERQHMPSRGQAALELCGAEEHHSCSPGPSVVVSGGQFVWHWVAGGGLSACWGAARAGRGSAAPGRGAPEVSTVRRTSRRGMFHARWRPPTPGWAICKPHTPVRQRCGQRPPAQLSGGSSRQPGRCGHLPAVTPAVAPAVRSPGALGAQGERSGSRRCALRRQAARAERPQRPLELADFEPDRGRARRARESNAIVKRFACRFAKKLARRYVRCAPNSGVAWGF